jgi:hypothetical protein
VATAMSGHLALNVTGVRCSECRKPGGVAKVCFKLPMRYFWGCARFPAWKGPRAWQEIDVPQTQRDECDVAFKASETKKTASGTSEGKKRARATAIPGDIGITKRVSEDMVVKRERKSATRVSSVQRQCCSCLTFSGTKRMKMEAGICGAVAKLVVHALGRPASCENPICRGRA